MKELKNVLEPGSRQPGRNVPRLAGVALTVGRYQIKSKCIMSVLCLRSCVSFKNSIFPDHPINQEAVWSVILVLSPPPLASGEYIL